MKAKPQKLSPAAKDGQAIAAWLLERAAHTMLSQYSNRGVKIEGGPASKRVNALMDELRSALNTRAHEPAIADALQKLDGAIWDVAVEHEDRAWFAAWYTAMGLITGGTFLRTNSHYANGIGSRTRTD